MVRVGIPACKSWLIVFATFTAVQRPNRQSLDSQQNLVMEAPQPTGSLSEMVTMTQLAHEVWPAATALAVSVGSATLFFPFFTYIPSSGRLATMLPQVLFFTRTLSDIVGRFIPYTCLGLHTKRGLHSMTLVKLAALPLGFWYITSTTARSDFLAVLYVSLFWLQSGVVNSACFVMAAEWASQGLQERAGGLLALVFQTSCLFALGLAYLIQRNCTPFKSEWA